jgi:type III pantothenate kinase
MIPRVVVDVGNTSIKWGLCSEAGVGHTCPLLPEDVAAWNDTAAAWRLPSPIGWAVAGVHPARRDAFCQWVVGRGDSLLVLEDWRRLPLQVNVPEPGKVGIDRLLDAVAANSRRGAGEGAVVVDAGTAVTVDYVDEAGVFQGGAILPGFRLMARALHEHTALLPLVEPPDQAPRPPAKATVPALKAGIFFAVAGGVRALAERYGGRAVPRRTFLTGGDARRISGHVLGAELWPEMTLQGIFLSARALP